MGLRIHTNVESLISQNRLFDTREKLKATQRRLATGSRIVSGKDDAAGLAISERMRAGIRATSQNIRNTADGFYLLQTADGALNEVANILIRMKELAVQSSTGSVGDRERAHIQNEYEFLQEEIDRIAEATSFNQRTLLNGEGGYVDVQVGPNNRGALDRIRVTQNFNIRTDALGINELRLVTREDAWASLEPLEAALSEVSRVRGTIGAGESRLQSTMNSLMHYKENITGAYSQVRDADLAVETSDYAKYQVLSQAGVAILAQANSTPEAALKLLG